LLILRGLVQGLLTQTKGFDDEGDVEHNLPRATRDEHFIPITGLRMLDWR
jgi:hypothetical protein